ncbi:pentapeptide repeat-containing protein [Acerihabitans sp. KWT182]|uniref:Pentapeptide repeat-containing protein n=1 Tax=Acerihabitans sp. KWT182 TaxID=3157919 RepID=A0AAU7Q9M7_9GAMM
MNVVLSTIKAHLFNSCTSAIDLVQNNPSPYNIHIAKCLLSAKMTALNLLLSDPQKRSEVNEAKVNKYNNLLVKLNNLTHHLQIDSPPRLSRSTQNDLPAGANHKHILIEAATDEFTKLFKSKIACLSGIDFINRDLRHLDFENANELPFSRGMPCSENFTGANLTGVDLSGAFLEGSNFKGATLNHAKLQINCANFTDAALDNADITINPPEAWDEWHLDCLLNSDNNQDTIFSTINTIDDKYRDLKVNLIHQIIDSLVQDNVDMEDPTFPKSVMINTLFSKEFYLHDEKIRLYCDKLLQKEIIKANEKTLLNGFNKAALLFLLDTIANSAKANKQKYYMIDNNGFFNQLMVLCAHNDAAEIREKARAIYNDYLKLDEVKIYADKKGIR